MTRYRNDIRLLTRKRKGVPLGCGIAPRKQEILERLGKSSASLPRCYLYAICCCLVIILIIFLIVTFTCPAQPVTRFTLSDLLDKPWSQVSSLSPPVLAFIFIAHRVQHYHFFAFHARLFSPNYANPCSRPFRSSISTQEKSLRARGCMHTVRLEPTTLTIVGTRFTHHSIGDANI